jgi:hypothetical protein
MDGTRDAGTSDGRRGAAVLTVPPLPTEKIKARAVIVARFITSDTFAAELAAKAEAKAAEERAKVERTRERREKQEKAKADKAAAAAARKRRLSGQQQRPCSSAGAHCCGS